MKKRILGLVLALCMIVGLLPVVALAEDPVTASVVITTGNNDAKVQWKPTLSEGMAPAYAKTTAEGALVLTGATEADYNLKVEWPAGGKPTLTMKGATLVNETFNPSKVNTIAIGGSVDFIIKLSGSNTINGNPSRTSQTTAAYNCPTGIAASNSGVLTIQGATKADTLTIDNKSGTGISKSKGNFVIETATVNIVTFNRGGSGVNSQHAIEVIGSDAGFTVRNAKLDCTIGGYHANFAVLLSDTSYKNNDSNLNGNAGDILFQNSEIRLYRSNSTGSTQKGTALIQFGANSSFTIDNCGVYIHSRHIIARYAPTLVNMKEATYKPESGTQTPWTYSAGTDISTTKITAFTATHNCTDAAPDDFDCTTPLECVICGADMSTAEAAHVPAADDSDCATPVMCTNSGCQQVAAPAGHIPGTDDGDCTTAVKCLYCTADAIPAATHIFTDAADTTCDNEGCNHVRVVLTSTLVITTGTHTAKVQWKPTLTEGMAPAYAKTTAEGALVLDGATETDYNLKVEWPTGKAPVLTLNNATLTNNVHHMSDSDPAKADTIVIGGTANFEIQLKGTNTINDFPDCPADRKVSAYRAPFGIVADNKGDLTIRGNNKATDALYIINYVGYAITSSYGALNIENATLDLALYGIVNNYAQVGILMKYMAAGYEDKTNLNVRNSNFKIVVGDNSIASRDPYSSYAIVMAKDSEKLDSTNTGDLLFENSTVYLRRYNKSGRPEGIVRTGANNTITFDRCDMSTCYSWRTVFNYIPVVKNYSSAIYTQESDSKVVDYDPAVAGTAVNIRSLTLTHACTAPADADCTTDDFCAMCGGALGNSAAHTPAADDGDCTSAVMCANPGCAQVAIPAAANHTPDADDGDCTTAIKCTECDTETTPAKATHIGGTATCKDKAKCTTCGKEYGELLTTHVPNADDGDCTTAITCSICGTETTPAASHTGGTATCKDKAKCTNCGKEYGELRATHDPAQRTDCTVDTMCTTCGQVAIPAGTHIPEADDGDCTTAIKCSDCGTETTPAAANHAPAADDGDCTTAITCSTCGTVTTPAEASHTGGTATCKDKAKCTNCGKEYGALLTTHVPNADDGDCTTEIKCSICEAVTTPAATHTGGTATCKDKAKCTNCGKEYGELLTTHVPATDDGDCTTAIKCSICETETTAAKAAHTPAADDGDCTTAIKCADCDKETTAAAAAHTGGTATCKAKAKCTKCSKEYGELAAHTPAADDGDCTTAIKCTVCDAVTTAAATHTGGTATCKAKAKCATCAKEYGELAAHAPAADDGDCTTAIKCTVCEAETTVAKTGHTYANDKDTTCDDPGCKATRTVTDNPKTGDNTLTMLFVTMAVSVAGLMAMAYAFIYNKKGNNY